MKYTAITIGPIYRTMLKTRSTKSIWSASYLFSYLMKLIYQEVLKEIDKENILLPYVSNAMLNGKLEVKTGLFPDRIIFEGSLNDFENLEKTVVNTISKLIANDIQENIDEVERYLQNYLTIKSVTKDIESGNVILTMDNYLNVQELQQQASQSNKKYLDTFFELKENGYNTFIKDEFKGQPFQTISEIATGLLKHDLKDNDRADFYASVKSDFDNYKPLHKYIAIIQADGDNIGALVKKLGETSSNFKEDIQAFSKCLYDFSIEALKVIENWKGVPIYAGGDDLLFFAPVADVKINEQKKVTVDKTILNVLNEISELFIKIITEKYEYLELDEKPSISFGVNISYHKFPLDQSLSLAYEQLNLAKSGSKNAIAMNIIKHSGQSFGSVFKLNNNYFSKLLNFLNTDDEKDFIANFMYKTNVLKSIFEGIGTIDEDEKRNNRFTETFINLFDEDIHKESLKKGFLHRVNELTQQIYSENRLLSSLTEKQISKRNENNIKKLYSSLRYYDFIYSTKDEKA